jgi:hypothetical protein
MARRCADPIRRKAPRRRSIWFSAFAAQQLLVLGQIKVATCIEVPNAGERVARSLWRMAMDFGDDTERAATRSGGLIASTEPGASPLRSGRAPSESPAAWVEDLAPIAAADWNRERARHLLYRAGFGGTSQDIERLAEMTPAEAVACLVDYEKIENGHLAPFEHSGVYDPSLKLFPESRPAATRLAAAIGHAMGVSVKPSGFRRMQPVVDRFFFWLRASALETRRVANWWGDCMVATNRPLEEKVALFWHGHFATSGDKVRDYRKMLVQLHLFHRHATGNFRDLLIGVAQDPAMLVFLDAGQNVKDAPNENFGREVMELFTMGVGNYTEHDIREAARAFTGWVDDDLSFKLDDAKHDTGPKTFLGRTGNFDGVEILDIILQQKVTANHIAEKIYHFFVRNDPSPALVEQLGAVLRNKDYEIKPLLRTIFLSRDFYSDPSIGTRIKGPVELIITMYRELGLKQLPGVPDFNAVTSELGQVLLNPPTVAGWAQGRTWITPGMLLARGNLARQVLLPDMINFVDPNLDPGPQVREVNNRIQRGMDVASATMEGNPADGIKADEAGKAMANILAEKEDFNTRYGSLNGWREAVRKIRPIVRMPAQVSLTEIVLSARPDTTTEVVDLLLDRFLCVPVAAAARATMIRFLDDQLGTSEIKRTVTYLEEPLRLLVHLITSTPEYQLG